MHLSRLHMPFQSVPRKNCIPLITFLYKDYLLFNILLVLVMIMLVTDSVHLPKIIITYYVIINKFQFMSIQYRNHFSIFELHY